MVRSNAGHDPERERPNARAQKGGGRKRGDERERRRGNVLHMWHYDKRGRGRNG